MATQNTQESNKVLLKSIREYIKTTVKKYNDIDLINSDIQDLKEKLYRCKDINFNEIGFKSTSSYKGIEDLIISCKDLIYIKETEIETIEREYNKLMLYISKLTKNETDVINYKYIYKTENNTNYTNTRISEELHQSLATVKRTEKSAILKINKMKLENRKRIIA